MDVATGLGQTTMVTGVIPTKQTWQQDGLGMKLAKAGKDGVPRATESGMEAGVVGRMIAKEGAAGRTMIGARVLAPHLRPRAKGLRDVAPVVGGLRARASDGSRLARQMWREMEKSERMTIFAAPKVVESGLARPKQLEARATSAMMRFPRRKTGPPAGKAMSNKVAVKLVGSGA